MCACKECCLSQIKDNKEPETGVWTITLEHMLNGHMVQCGLSPIRFSSDHNLDEQLHKGVCMNNSRAQWIGEKKCKVETLEVVITELRNVAKECNKTTLEIPKCKGDPSKQEDVQPPTMHAHCEFTLG